MRKPLPGNASFISRLVISHNPSLAGENCVTGDYGFLIFLTDDVIIISFGISFSRSGLRRAIPSSLGNTEKKDPPCQALALLVGSCFFLYCPCRQGLPYTKTRF